VGVYSALTATTPARGSAARSIRARYSPSVSCASASQEEAAQSESSASSFDSAVLVDSDPESMLAAELFGMGFSDEEVAHSSHTIVWPVTLL